MYNNIYQNRCIVKRKGLGKDLTRRHGGSGNEALILLLFYLLHLLIFTGSPNKKNGYAHK